MSTLGRGTMKTETFSTQQPDGTIVTTTTKTETIPPYGIESDYFYEDEYTVTAVNCDYCCKPWSWLRILQVVFCLIIVSCITSVFGTGPFIGVLVGHTFALILASLCMCITFILLVVLFLGLHTTYLSEMPWRKIDLVYSIIAAILFLIAAILEAWYCSGEWQDCTSAQRLRDRCPIYWAWGVAALFCVLNCFLYVVSACLAAQKHFFS